MIKLSLITVTCNNARGIKKTFSSLKSDNFENVEHIVIDNRSSDGTLSFLESLNQPRLRIYSEADHGIYDAMNKGLKISTGDYVYFLNAGDRVIDLTNLLALTSSAQGIDLICCNILYEGFFRKIPIRVNSSLVYPQRYQHDIPPQPACIFKTSTLRDIGGFDAEFRVAGDVELMLRLLKRVGTTHQFLDDFISIFEGFGISENPELDNLIFAERKLAISKNCPEFLKYFSENHQCHIKKFKILKALAFRSLKVMYTLRDKSRFWRDP